MPWRNYCCFFLALTFSVIFIGNYSVYSETIYKWTDEKGQLHFTDYPPPISQKQKKERTRSFFEGRETKNTVENEIPDKSIDLDSEIEKELREQIIEEEPKTVLPETKSETETWRKLVPDQLESFIGKKKTGKEKLAPTHKLLAKYPVVGVIQLAVKVIIYLSFGIYYLISLHRIAIYLGVEHPWLAWIPIVNIYTMVKAGDKPGSWFFLIFFPFVVVLLGTLIVKLLPIFGIAFILFLIISPIISFVYYIKVWMAICENLGLSKNLALLMLFLPLLGWVLSMISELITPTDILGATLYIILSTVALLPIAAELVLPGYYYWLSGHSKRKSPIKKPV